MEEELLPDATGTSIVTELDVLTLISASNEAILNRLELVILLMTFIGAIFMYSILRRNRSDI